MLQNRNSFHCVVILIQSEIIESAERSWKYFKHIFNFYIWISWVTEWMPICLMRNTKDIFVSLRQINIILVNARRNSDVIITSKRRRDIVLT